MRDTGLLSLARPVPPTPDDLFGDAIRALSRLAPSVDQSGVLPDMIGGTVRLLIEERERGA